ncbi:glycosyltransferase [Shimia abyssi]|uniref:GT2 family glycosyltransferase n=1 Tax=Shimia abyssi TaxID=1662395 RepID=A0A2P8FBU4_9RHOB|nr:glycosyltransferase [Shimia abyssi]PSL19180.1 GT2 family glycosyltransferase [Shimia abyssi]
MSAVTAIVIGRNEGARLVACLQSLTQQNVPIVYVDSGSRDGSVDAATSAGALVVELDTQRPFTAARARQAGVDALREKGDLPEFLQFVDGDCAVVPGWIDAAVAALSGDTRLGLATGWRSEIHPERSVYNALCDFEWHGPAGEIDVCGGDMMVRSAAFEDIGGFDTVMIACEDFDFCLRMGKAGWGLRRLPQDMTRHDADMTRFSQWWQRAVRAGHGYGEAAARHPGRFRRELLRAWVYGAVLPVLGLVGLVANCWLLAVVLAAYLLNFIRTSKGLQNAGLSAQAARAHGALITLSKLPNLLGLLKYYRRRMTGQDMRIIEYK